MYMDPAQDAMRLNPKIISLRLNMFFSTTAVSDQQLTPGIKDKKYHKSRKCRDKSRKNQIMKLWYCIFPSSGFIKRGKMIGT